LGFGFADVRAARRAALDLKNNFGHHFIQTCRANPNPNPSSVVYLMIQDDDYENDDQRARDCLLYFFAGFETTAHSIAWTMLELARNPKEQTKLRAALNDHVKNMVTDIKYCPELKHVTREVLRLHTPAALGSVRQIAEDITYTPPNTTKSNANNQKQIFIPKGSYCSVILYVLLRNHHIFENPDDFFPSRWETPTEEMQRAFLPFALGRRNCQGQALANLELNTVVARLVQKYKMRVEEEGEASYMITLRPKGSKLRLTKL
jgi:cytochrome P450